MKAAPTKKAPGLVIFLCEILVVFLNYPRRETPKNITNKNRDREKIVFCRFFVDFFVQIIFTAKRFFW
jgi:hypothetical protein